MTMNLEFVKIGNRGKEDEYILFKAKGNCQLHNYLVHDDTFDKDGELSNVLRHMYRFPTKTVKKDEYVALYVKREGVYRKGTYNEITCHIFYWGTNTNIFNQDSDRLFLLLIAQTNMAVIK